MIVMMPIIIIIIMITTATNIIIITIILTCAYMYIYIYMYTCLQYKQYQCALCRGAPGPSPRAFLPICLLLFRCMCLYVISIYLSITTIEWLCDCVLYLRHCVFY